MVYFLSTISLTIVYLLLTGDLSFINLSYGVILAVVISILMRPSKIKPDWRRSPTFIWAVLRYSMLLMYDLFKSGFQIARLVLDVKLPIHPDIISFPIECQSDLALSLSMHAMTLTPGELVIELNQYNELKIHVLDASKSIETITQVHRQREKLLRDIFI